MPDGRAKVVIVGAGFGGIEAAKSLRRAPVEVTVIDRQNHHCFQPLLYQVATAALSPADVAWPIRHILREQKQRTVLMAEVRAVDTSKRRRQIDRRASPTTISCSPPARRIPISATTNGPSWRPGLKRIEDATRIRRQHSALPSSARSWPPTRPSASACSPSRSSAAAPTGVEMAGAIAEIARQTPGDGFPPHRSSHGAHRPDRSRAAYPAGTAGEPFGLCRRTLARMGVEVMTRRAW